MEFGGHNFQKLYNIQNTKKSLIYHIVVYPYLNSKNCFLPLWAQKVTSLLLFLSGPSSIFHRVRNFSLSRSGAFKLVQDTWTSIIFVNMTELLKQS